ncbi:hypothetical protein M0Q50_03580 [bacterium]|jgi:hypothetical protein|nr:hypothetical protein [bacterium]
MSDDKIKDEIRKKVESLIETEYDSEFDINNISVENVLFEDEEKCIIDFDIIKKTCVSYIETTITILPNSSSIS